MKFIKKIPLIVFVIIPIILVVVFAYLLYVSDKKLARLKQGIDLNPRPFSELLEMDFANVKDETIQDISKCDSKRVLEQLEKDSTNPNLADNWIGYDPKIHKLTILDNCWRLYENEHIKIKFRDLNDSLTVQGANSFTLKDTNPQSFGILTLKKNKLSLDKAIIEFLKLTAQDFKGIKTFINPNKVNIYRAESMRYTYKHEKNISYFIDLPESDNYFYIWGYKKRAIKDILYTIELK